MNDGNETVGDTYMVEYVWILYHRRMTVINPHTHATISIAYKIANKIYQSRNEELVLRFNTWDVDEWSLVS
jgi:hypothetical protein